MALPGLPPPEWFDNTLQSSSAEIAAPRPALGPGGTFVGGVTNLLNGITFNLADEGISYLASPLVALGSGKSLGEAKDAVLKNVRQNVTDFRSEHPYASFLGDVAGGLYGLGKLGFASKVEQAPAVLNSKFLGRSYAMAKEGGKLGGVYGFGAGDDGLGNRVESAGAGALVGALTAPVLGGAIEGGANVAQWAGRKVSDNLPIETLRRLARDQKGAVGSDIGGVGNSGGGPRGSLTPEELILAKQLKDTPIENIFAAKTEMDSALRDQAPLFLPEALKSAKVDRNARFVANYDPSMEFSQAQIRARTADAANRASKLFDINVSSNQGSEGASRLVKAADDIIAGAENARKLQSSPLYRAAYDEVPLIQSTNLTELLAKDRVLTQAIKEVKKTANNADFADNSSELLVKVRGEVWDQIEKAKAQGANRTARDLQDTYQRLNNILHTENPGLATADLVHANASKGIDALNDTFLTRLQKMTDDQVNNVSQIFNLPAERIAQLRNTFDEAGKIGDWNAGIRSHLQNLVEGTKEGRNFVDKISGNTLQQAKLKAALGDKAFETVQKGLGLENRFFEGKNKYFAGSSTAGNLEEAANFKKNIGVVKNLLNFDFASLARAFVERGMPEQTAQNLAKIYFDPQTGQETLNRIIPLVRQIAKERALSAQLGQNTGLLGASEISRLSQLANAEPQVPRRAAPAKSGAGAQQSTQKPAPAASAGRKDQAAPFPAGQESPSLDRTSTLEAIQPRFSLAQLPEAIKELHPFVQAMIQVESGGNPLAESKKGAKGLMQIMPAVAKAYGIDPTDPVDNIRVGTQEISQHLERFGDARLALIAYNWGQGNLAKLIKRVGSERFETLYPYLPRETQKYVGKVERQFQNLLGV